jgi:hypothetical protein
LNGCSLILFYIKLIGYKIYLQFEVKKFEQSMGFLATEMAEYRLYIPPFLP